MPKSFGRAGQNVRQHLKINLGKAGPKLVQQCTSDPKNQVSIFLMDLVRNAFPDIAYLYPDGTPILPTFILILPRSFTNQKTKKFYFSKFICK